MKVAFCGLDEFPADRQQQRIQSEFIGDLPDPFHILKAGRIGIVDFTGDRIKRFSVDKKNSFPVIISDL